MSSIFERIFLRTASSTPLLPLMIHKARIIWAKQESLWRNSELNDITILQWDFLHWCHSFFLIAFANFVEESDVAFSQSFSSWLETRTEIWKYVFLTDGPDADNNVSRFKSSDLSSKTTWLSFERLRSGEWLVNFVKNGFSNEVAATGKEERCRDCGRADSRRRVFRPCR
jgi:hypothetical protein